MAVQFVLGRAGTGKTHLCLEAVREHLRVDPVDGPRLIVLVPEQAALQTERSLLAAPDITAAHRAEVLSFQRLAYKVLDRASVDSRAVLSDAARPMVLRLVLARHSRRLAYYRRPGRARGLVEQLSKAVAELLQESISPEQLDAAADASSSADAGRAAKLRDLALIYREYLAYLGDARLDPMMFQQVARERMDACPWFDRALVWVDGFASFMREEALTLAALARRATTVVITLLMDPALLLGPRAADPVDRRLFSRTTRTWRELNRLLHDEGVEVAEPMGLSSASPPRFVRSPALRAIESRLVGLIATPGESGQRINSTAAVAADRPAMSESSPDEPDARVELAYAPTRRIEVEHAVSTVMRWAREHGLRYREIAIITRDIEAYHDLLSASLNARGIPYFIDRRRPIGHHSLVELLRATGELIANDLSLDSVRLLLRTGLTPLMDDEADELENYLLAHDIHGHTIWFGDDWDFTMSRPLESDRRRRPPEESAAPRANELRRRWLDPFISWIEFGRSGPHSGARWVHELGSLFTRLAVVSRVEEWCARLAAEGERDAAAEHEQLLRDTSQFLSDLSAAFDDTKLSATELSDVIEAGLGQLTLGLAPPMLDQLMVGTIDRSRQPDLRGLVVLGLNEGVFPAVATEKAILHDDDRLWLEQHGARLSPTSAERLRDEETLLYIAMTRASERLLLTYAGASADGEPLQPSPYVELLRAACPEISIRHVADPAVDGGSWDALTPRDLLSRLVTEFRARGDGDTNEPRHALWNGLYRAERASIVKDAVARHAMRSLVEPANLDVRTRLVDGMFDRRGARMSVSRLEAYAACPFRGFAEHLLHLRERALATVDANDKGTVQHAVLDEFVRGVTKSRTQLTSLDEAEVDRRLRQSCESVSARLPRHGALQTARTRYQVRRVADHLRAALLQQQRAASVGAFRPHSTERPFGYEHESDESLPPIRIRTPGGRELLLRGYIDRVDVADAGGESVGLVIDYKSAPGMRWNVPEFYWGLGLQLTTYLLALEVFEGQPAAKRIAPVAALYASLARRYESVNHPSEKNGGELRGGFKLRGVLREDCADLLHQSLEGTSPWFALWRNKNGTLGYRSRSDALSRDEFSLVLQHARRKLGELGDGVLDGIFDVRPMVGKTDKSCTYCRMKAVCRYENGLHTPRYLDPMSRDALLQQLKIEQSGKQTAPRP